MLRQLLSVPMLARRLPRNLSRLRSFVTAASSCHGGTEGTAHHLHVDAKTRIIYQGEKHTPPAAYASRNRLAHLRSPRLHRTGGKRDVRLDAMDNVAPHVSAVFVPAPFAAAAIVEAVEAEVPLIVAVAEHVPVHDLLRVHEVLRTQSRSRLVGPNSPGIIAPEQCRVGIMPFAQYRRGRVGIVSKSGTLSYEAVGATTAAGLGQSLVLAVGGDAMPGTSISDALAVFFAQPETEGIIVIGEIGGEQELRAAELIRRYRASTSHPKPIVAMVAGQTAPRGRTMGHAGAFLSPRDATAKEKAAALERAGAVIVPHPGVMGVVMKELLATTCAG
ncbi:succinate-CoA ligase [Drechmeria coniospora]|uniref:Succinate-CoA ligase n=1 Tax=Drechmeria coniospora TaxID=98403 RepID=A0A151GJV5_DRECN|nr:succinate-CoA ligase [Drechmeria coniospora]KYK57369.1 succinate-CoA ligase [Drechmeria coniospora]